jgi:hypothetical protein
VILDRATLNDLRAFAEHERTRTTTAFARPDRRCCQFRFMLDCAELVTQHTTSNGQAVAYLYPFPNVEVMALVLDTNITSTNTGYRKCSECDGEGRVTYDGNVRTYRIDCPACDGDGRVRAARGEEEPAFDSEYGPHLRMVTLDGEDLGMPTTGQWSDIVNVETAHKVWMAFKQWRHERDLVNAVEAA